MNDELSTFAAVGLEAALARKPLPPPQPRTAEPSSIIVSGIVADPDGFVRWTVDTAVKTPDGTLLAARRDTVVSQDPATDYAAEHPTRIPVLLDHDTTRRVGEVLHLERRHGKLFAVAKVALDYEEAKAMQFRWSSGTGQTKPYRIVELSLTTAPASVGLPPVKFYPAQTLQQALAWPGNRDLLRRAITATQQRRKGDPIWIDDLEIPDLGDPAAEVLMERSAAAVHTSTSQRIIEVLAVPYNTKTAIVWRGQRWTESFKPGSFREFIKSGELPRVNREHQRGDTVGKIVELRETAAGLVAMIQIARTLRGDETFALAEEDMISASVGFSFLDPGGRIVDLHTRSIRVLRAKLDHLSLVEAPAYAGAKVLSVRRQAGR